MIDTRKSELIAIGVLNTVGKINKLGEPDRDTTYRSKQQGKRSSME